MLDRPPFSGAAGPTLHFVYHEQNAVTITDAAELLHENVRGDDIAAFPLDGLDENGGDFFGWKIGFEELIFDEAGTAQGKGFGVLRAALAAAVDVGKADVGNPRNQRREAAALLRLRRS